MVCSTLDSLDLLRKQGLTELGIRRVFEIAGFESIPRPDASIDDAALRRIDTAAERVLSEGKSGEVVEPAGDYKIEEEDDSVSPLYEEGEAEERVHIGELRADERVNSDLEIPRILSTLGITPDEEGFISTSQRDAFFDHLSSPSSSPSSVESGSSEAKGWRVTALSAIAVLFIVLIVWGTESGAITWGAGGWPPSGETVANANDSSSESSESVESSDNADSKKATTGDDGAKGSNPAMFPGWAKAGEAQATKRADAKEQAKATLSIPPAGAKEDGPSPKPNADDNASPGAKAEKSKDEIVGKSFELPLWIFPPTCCCWFGECSCRRPSPPPKEGPSIPPFTAPRWYDWFDVARDAKGNLLTKVSPPDKNGRVIITWLTRNKVSGRRIAWKSEIFAVDAPVKRSFSSIRFDTGHLHDGDFVVGKTKKIAGVHYLVVRTPGVRVIGM